MHVHISLFDREITREKHTFWLDTFWPSRKSASTYYGIIIIIREDVPELNIKTLARQTDIQDVTSLSKRKWPFHACARSSSSSSSCCDLAIWLDYSRKRAGPSIKLTCKFRWEYYPATDTHIFTSFARTPVHYNPTDFVLLSPITNIWSVFFTEMTFSSRPTEAQI